MGKYYRVYLSSSAHPDFYGVGYASHVPREPAALEDWIKRTTQLLENKEGRDKLFDWEDYDVGIGSNWTLGSLFIEWTYVIDFDNRVFTVNGAVHFSFDNMPPLYPSDSEPGFVGYLQSYERIQIPAKYLKSIDLWPAPRFDVTEARQQYVELQPAIAGLAEWGTPTWDSLSVPQRLAAIIVRTLVYDYSDELALAHYPTVWHKVGLFCWQVANAAAPSHLICPPLSVTPQNDVLYVRTDLAREPRSTIQTIHHHMGGKGTLGRYCWFRGCLITFCPRLDEPTYVMHHVAEMVHRLRSHGGTSGIGVMMSGWHTISVAVDGSEIRHSPVVELHDGKELKEGILLLMHLLSPTFTCLKTPWRAEPPIHQTSSVSSALPDDVLRQIIHYTDIETYLSFHLVSRNIRSICLAYPRVGHHILLGYEANANSEPLFRVRSTGSTYSALATLNRTKATIDKPPPIWRFNFKLYSKCVLNPGLAGTFQYPQSGIGPVDVSVGEEYNHTVPDYGPWPVTFREMIKKDMHHDMRIQTVDGIWEMTTCLDGAPTWGETDQNFSEGSGLYELMTGFEGSDIDELSEVDERYSPNGTSDWAEED